MQKKIRIFLSERLEENNKIALGKDQSHYISNVMRLKSGDELLLFNGIDGEFLGKVAGSEKNKPPFKFMQNREISLGLQIFP